MAVEDSGKTPVIKKVFFVRHNTEMRAMMKKFSYVCDFLRKDPDNPEKEISIERHLFVFVVGNSSEQGTQKGRLAEWWDPFNLKGPADK